MGRSCEGWIGGEGGRGGGREGGRGGKEEGDDESEVGTTKLGRYKRKEEQAQHKTNFDRISISSIYIGRERRRGAGREGGREGGRGKRDREGNLMPTHMYGGRDGMGGKGLGVNLLHIPREKGRDREGGREGGEGGREGGGSISEDGEGKKGFKISQQFLSQ